MKQCSIYHFLLFYYLEHAKLSVCICFWMLPHSHILGPPKLTIEPPDEVWFEPAQIDDFLENKLTLRCEADGDPELLVFLLSFVLLFNNLIEKPYLGLNGRKTMKSLKSMVNKFYGKILQTAGQYYLLSHLLSMQDIINALYQTFMERQFQIGYTCNWECWDTFPLGP